MAFVQPIVTGTGPESLASLLLALQNLEHVAFEVFGTISSRIEHEKNNIDAFGERINVAQSKVHHLSNRSKEAICSLSPNRYPAGSFKYANLLFPEELENLNRPHKLMKQEITTSFQLDYKSRTKRDALHSNHLPEYVNSVSNLLLFNDRTSPYKQSLAHNNSELTSEFEKHERTTEMTPSQLTIPAPPSVSGNYQMPVSNPSYVSSFTPQAHRLPSFQVPIDLPDLESVATNINCLINVADLPDICPSKVIDALPPVPNPIHSTVVSSPTEPSKPEQNVETPPPLPPRTPRLREPKVFEKVEKKIERVEKKIEVEKTVVKVEQQVEKVEARKTVSPLPAESEQPIIQCGNTQTDHARVQPSNPSPTTPKKAPYRRRRLAATPAKTEEPNQKTPVVQPYTPDLQDVLIKAIDTLRGAVGDSESESEEESSEEPDKWN